MLKKKGLYGFTLIELSIVLVIIGLVVGGILVGRDMIFQSEVRSVITDIEQFNSAAATFRSKYDCLPGDCNKATDFFGTKSTGCPAGSTPSAGTCNGDNNNQVDGFKTGTKAYGGSSLTVEVFLFWQHLALAKLVPGSYTGLAGAAGDRQSLIGTNVAASRLRNAGYTLYWYFSANSGGRFYAAPSHFFEFGVQPGPFGNAYETDGFVMSPAEAFAFDKKFDDSLPAAGRVMTIFNSTAGNCVDAPDSTALYRINVSGMQCSFLIKAGF